MEFLDSLDIDSVNKKCNRVRSWYLYEQYKSLEENQLDATLRLKNKSYQDHILKRELTERRARRRLCDQFGLCQSESRLEKSICSVPSQVPVNDDDLFESFCELYEEYELENYEDNDSQVSHTSKDIEDFTSVDPSKDGYAESVNSVVKNVIKKFNSADNIREQLETVKQNIAETINLQLETAKENIKCLEKFTKLPDDEEILENNLPTNTLKLNTGSCCKFNPIRENIILAVWSKFVNFAYKIINLNHGNCYSDYSSQLFTAVLACDFLLRGINRMCYIWRPYVSPIKYSTSDSEASLISNSKENRKTSFLKNKRSIKELAGNRKKYCKKLRNYNKKFNSESDWYNCCKDSLENYLNEMKYRCTSEPLPPRGTKFSNGKRNSEKSSNRWPEDLKSEKILEENVCRCRGLKGIVKSLLHITRYIESLLQDMEEK